MNLTHALLGEQAVLYRLFDHLDRSVADFELADCQVWGRLEEAALFPMAEGCLGAAPLEALGAQWAAERLPRTSRCH